MFPHRAEWPPAVAPDRVAARLTALCSDRGWSRLCNGMPLLAERIQIHMPHLVDHRHIALLAMVSIAAVVWAAWKVIGRMWRRMEGVGAESATISLENVSAQVVEPSGHDKNGHDKNAHPARTIDTTLNRLDEAKAQLNRVLDQQRRFVRDASHELRTPIAGLRLRLEEAQLHPAETDLDHLLEHALNDVDRLQKITTGLLLLASPDTGTSAPETQRTLDLAELVRTQLSARPDQHTVQRRLEPGVMVNAVPTQLTNLLTHLLDNAQRHTEQTVRIEVSRSGDNAQLSVTDDGDGIAETDHERIFQPFTRLDHARSRDHGGTGLGLAIARHIATTHHGTLTIDDPPTGGATFTLRLPRRDA